MKLFLAAILLVNLGGQIFYGAVVHGIAQGIVLYQVQTAGSVSGTANQEVVLWHNTSPDDVVVTDWCLRYTNATKTTVRTQGCVVAPDDNSDVVLVAGGTAAFATQDFVNAHSGFTPDVVMSGSGMAASGGQVWIENNNEVEVDRFAWGDAVVVSGEIAAPVVSAGLVYGRTFVGGLLVDTDVYVADFSAQQLQAVVVSGLIEQQKPFDFCRNISGVQLEAPPGYGADDFGDCVLDMCNNLDGLQVELPTGYVAAGTLECHPIVLSNLPLLLTEIYANAPGSDTSLEFIELYNPTTQDVSLKGYRIAVGPSFTKQYNLPEITIRAGAYEILSDTQSGIVLPNATGVALQAITPAGNVASSSAAYTDAQDDQSWALIEDQWIVTNQITPRGANKPFLEPAVNEALGSTTILAPCPAGKYRNPDTNRCRAIETALSALVPCDEDEYRNPDTNRCRKLSSASSSELVPCDEGEERNPDTNRCRKITTAALPQSLPIISEVVASQQSSRVNIPFVAGSIVVSGIYMVYEWRNELRLRWGRRLSVLSR